MKADQNEVLERSSIQRVLLFAMAGGSGFVTDVAVLHLLLQTSPLGPFSARVLSIACALAVNFTVNRLYVFGDSGRTLFSEIMRYLPVALTGALLNYLLFAVMLLLVPALPPVLATMIAVIVVAVFSYTGYQRFVFKRV